jgi:dienelactone hydrolase
MPKHTVFGCYIFLLCSFLTQVALALDTPGPTSLKPEVLPGSSETVKLAAPMSQDTSVPAKAEPTGLFKDLITEVDANTQVVELGVSDQRFQALFVPAAGKKQQGAVLLLADSGQHPDWPGPIKNVRQRLPEYGWATLSFALSAAPDKADSADVSGAQTPPVIPDNNPVNSGVTPTDAGTTAQRPNPLLADKALQITQTQARLQACLDYLKQQGLYNIVVLGVGDGAQISAKIITTQPTNSVAGFIALAPWSLLEQDQTEITETFTDLPIPVMELLPSQWPEPRSQARKLLAQKKQRTNYSQIKLQDSALDFNHSVQLVPRIRGWLKKHAESVEGTRQPKASD